MQYSQTCQLVDTLLLPIQTILGMGPITNTIPVLNFTFTYAYTHTDMGTQVSPAGDFGWGRWLTQTYPYTSTYTPFTTGSSLQKVTFADRAGLRTASMTHGVLGDYYPEAFLFGSQEYTYNTFIHHPRRPTSAAAGFKIIPHDGNYTESVPVTFTYHYNSAGAGAGSRSAARPSAESPKTRMNEMEEIHQFNYGQGQPDAYGNEGTLFPVEWLIDGQQSAKLLRLPNRSASYSECTSPVLALIRPNQSDPVFTTTYSITPQSVFYDSILTRDPDGAPITWRLYYADTSYGRMLDWAAATRMRATEFGFITETAQAYQFKFDSSKLTQLREWIASSITFTQEVTHTFSYVGWPGSYQRCIIASVTSEYGPGGGQAGVTEFAIKFSSNTASFSPGNIVRTHYYHPGENQPFLSNDPYNGAIYYLRDGKGRTMGHFSTGSYMPHLFIYAYDSQGRLSAHIGLVASVSKYMTGKQMDILLTYGYDANGDLQYAWQAEPFANLYTFLYDSEAYPDIILDSSSGGVIKRYMTYPPHRAGGGPRGFIAGAERFAHNAAIYYGIEFPLAVPPASPLIPPGKTEAFVAY